MPRSADRYGSIPPRPLRRLAGAALAFGIAALVALLLWSIFKAASSEPDAGATPVDILDLLRMTSVQAGLSTVFSLGVGIALAWALNRLRFPGRGLVVALFASAIVTPGIIVAFGLLSVWGRNGWINGVLDAVFGISVGNPIYGLPGIIAAHVILDGAFAARILLARLDAIPEARLKTGQSLALSAWQRFAVIDWPAMRSTLPGLAAIIFLLAFTSFPIVLLLGGGPANQTFEVAIYSAVRLDFDLAEAVRLALVQIGVCGAIIMAASAFSPVSAAIGPSRVQFWSDRLPARLLQTLVLILSLLGFGLPLLSVLLGGLSPAILDLALRPSFWAAAATSVVIATVSAALTAVLALTIAMARGATRGHVARVALGAPAYAYLAVPAVVLALGFFLLVRGIGIEPGFAAPIVVVIANALLALPFAVATLAPPLEAIARSQGKLIRSLGLSGGRQFALIELPMLGRELGVVLALAFCFSFGDLGVIALFGTNSFATLPLVMLRALSAYRTNDAAIIAALMLAITIIAFAALPRLVERFSHARA